MGLIGRRRRPENLSRPPEEFTGAVCVLPSQAESYTRLSWI
jgi:hypothetical protein